MSDLEALPMRQDAGTPDRARRTLVPPRAWVTGSCCDGWGLEFRNDYAWQDSPEQMQKAAEAWEYD